MSAADRCGGSAEHFADAEHVQKIRTYHAAVHGAAHVVAHGVKAPIGSIFVKPNKPSSVAQTISEYRPHFTTNSRIVLSRQVPSMSLLWIRIGYVPVPVCPYYGSGSGPPVSTLPLRKRPLELARTQQPAVSMQVRFSAVVRGAYHSLRAPLHQARLVPLTS